MLTVLQLQHVVEFHAGATVSSVNRATLVPGGREVILYTTFLGSVGVLIPFVSKDDVDFMQTLEMQMRNELPPLCGRDHLSYRSYYIPVRGCVDGDLCEQFNLLPPEKKRALAEDMEKTVAEVAKKLEDLRNRAAF